MTQRQLPPWWARPNFIKPGVPWVDWSNPLAYGLTGAYLPGLGSLRVLDLTDGVGADPICGAQAKFVTTLEGRALDTSAMAGGSGCFAVASKAQQPPTQATAFWRGIPLGPTPATNMYVFGVVFQDGNTAPFNAYAVTYETDGFLHAHAGTAGVGEWNVTMPNAPFKVPCDVAASIDVTANFQGFTGYFNGKLIGTNGIGVSTISYGTNPQLTIGGTSNASQAAPPVQTLAGYTWNRRLSDAEIMDLHIWPYQLLIFPQDMLKAGFQPTSHPAFDDGRQPPHQPIAY